MENASTISADSVLPEEQELQNRIDVSNLNTSSACSDEKHGGMITDTNTIGSDSNDDGSRMRGVRNNGCTSEERSADRGEGNFSFPLNEYNGIEDKDKHQDLKKEEACLERNQHLDEGPMVAGEERINSMGSSTCTNPTIMTHSPKNEISKNHKLIINHQLVKTPSPKIVNRVSRLFPSSGTPDRNVSNADGGAMLTSSPTSSKSSPKRKKKYDKKSYSRLQGLDGERAIDDKVWSGNKDWFNNKNEAIAASAIDPSDQLKVAALNEITLPDLEEGMSPSSLSNGLDSHTISLKTTSSHDGHDENKDSFINMTYSQSSVLSATHTNGIIAMKEKVSTIQSMTQQQRQNQPMDEQMDEQLYTKEEHQLIERFWKRYDDIIILSLFSILGILFRIAAANFFTKFNDVFNETSALFTNLPLNCLSCFIMGLLCSGDDAIRIVYTRLRISGGGNSVAAVDVPDENLREIYMKDNRNFTGGQGSLRHRQQWNDANTSTDNEYVISTNELQTKKRRMEEDEMREVQMIAFDRRIRASSSLVLFPAHKEDEDVMEHYFDGEHRHYHFQENENDVGAIVNNLNVDKQNESSRVKRHSDGNDETEDKNHSTFDPSSIQNNGRSSSLMVEEDLSPLDSPSAIFRRRKGKEEQQYVFEESAVLRKSTSRKTNISDDELSIEQGHVHSDGDERELDQLFVEAAENLKRLARINIADGWDVGTTPEAMKDGILLGLRVGFCGAVSTFSSWNSDMVNLLRSGHVNTAFIGYLIGIQLPIVSYRFGQHVAVFIFVWRCRRETKRDERRGYGLRLSDSVDNEDEDRDEFAKEVKDSYPKGALTDVNTNANAIDTISSANGIASKRRKRKAKNDGGRILDEDALAREIPSIRAIATAVFAMTMVCLLSAVSFFNGNLTIQRLSISLLFSPIGVLARWKLIAKFNSYFYAFPLGTFICNILGCALSGSLGSLLAGNPGPEESIVLVSIIAGFAGSLSTLATFVVEVLDRIDPILLNFDGLKYALITIFWAFNIGLIGSQAKNWADDLEGFSTKTE